MAAERANGDDEQDKVSEGSSAGLSDLDDDGFDLQGYRAERLEALKKEMDRARMMKEGGFGRLTEIKEEKVLLDTTAKAKLAVVHFFHRDFRRCAIMDKHLESLAAKHFSTLFVKADVANVPFLVDRLDIRVLPCVMCFVDSVSKDKIVGFEGLSESSDVDSFNTTALEMRLQASGVLSGATASKPDPSIFGFKNTRDIDGDESD